MNLYEKFGTDADAEAGQGIKISYGANTSFTIHRAGGANKRFQRRFEAKMKPYTRQIQQNTMDEDVAKQIFAEIYAETVVVAWEGVTDRDGNPLPFTYDNAVKLFLDLPDLFRDIQAAAQDRSLFLADAQDAAVGNSPTLSDGTSGGAPNTSSSPA